MQEGERQRARRARQADRLAHQEVERGQRLGHRRLGLALEEHRVEEAGEQRLLLRGDRADLLAEGQRDLGGVPVAAAGEAEDPRRQRRRQRRVLPQRRAGRLGAGRAGARCRTSGGRARACPGPARSISAPRLLERADLEQPVDARDQHRGVARPAPCGGSASASSSRWKSARAAGTPWSGWARISSRTCGAGLPAPRAPRAKPVCVGRQQAHRVAADLAERRHGDRVRRRPARRRAAARLGGGGVAAELDALRQPGDGAARLGGAAGQAPRRARRAARPARQRRPAAHLASTGSATSRCGAGRSEKIAKPTRPTHRDERRDRERSSRAIRILTCSAVPA